MSIAISDCIAPGLNLWIYLHSLCVLALGVPNWCQTVLQLCTGFCTDLFDSAQCYAHALAQSVIQLYMWGYCSAMMSST